LKRRSVELLLAVIKGFFGFCIVNDLVIVDPTEGLKLAGGRQTGVKKIFSETDITLFLESIGGGAPESDRDRALFELMYSSGLRVSDLLNLEIEHLNIDERVLLVKLGKGKKDRYVPFSETARAFLSGYLNGGRKMQLEKLKTETAKRYVFLGTDGRLRYMRLFKRFRRYIGNCSLSAEYTMHSIRHTTATHLLAHGASIRYVQELLGHEDLKTTQLYARPTEENIKAVYRTFHPRENELYIETDPEYLAELEKLKTRLIEGRKKCARYRETGTTRKL
jgi:site-specific recombinase XerD